MKHLSTLITIVFAISFAGCSSSKEPTGVWVNKEKAKGKTFGKVFIVVMTADLEARSIIENDLAQAATNRGYKAVKSIEAMPASLTDPKLPTKEEVVKTIKESGSDALIVATLLKKEEGVNYVPGTTKGTVQPYYTQTYYGYYSTSHSSVHTPGYYSHEKTYYIRTNLYDVASEEIMWTVESTIFNPASLPKFSKTYTMTLLAQLEKEKVLMK